MASSPFDGYITVARQLASQADEPSQRSSLSRAYYYVYHLALNRAENNGYRRLSGETAHAQLWRLYTTNPDATCQQLGNLGQRLQKNRERADYEKTFPRIDEEVQTALSDAVKFEIDLKALPARLPKRESMRT